MREVELWLDEDVVIEDANGNCYTGITHIDSRAGSNGYVETYDDEVILFSEMDEHMLADVEQLIEDYSYLLEPAATTELKPRKVKAIGWVRDEKGNVVSYTIKNIIQFFDA